jgi:fatty-acyl-CoA synthase
MAPTHTMLVTTPASHAASSMVDGALASGGTVILHDGFVAADVLAAVARHGVNRLYIAPPHLYALLDEPSLATTDLSSLRELYYGGCVASPVRLAAAVEAFGPVLYQIYGTAEGWMISLLTPPEHAKPELLGTVGKPLDFVEVTVRDPETRAALPDGTTGEITMRSPMLMDGYWGDPDLTARTIIDGWLHTGDIGYLDDQGYLHLIDRLAEMIKTNGTKVYPADVEKALLAHEKVSQVAVFGVRDEDNLEHIHAAVVPRPGTTPSSAELTEHVAAALSPAHQPSTVDIRSEIPLLDTGKPDKVRLRSEVSDGAR